MIGSTDAETPLTRDFHPAATASRAIDPPELVLFVNDPKLLGETYRRFLEARIREAEPFPGLPILMKCRPRQKIHL